MGMSFEDFCRCTPSEFQATWERWKGWQEGKEQAEWERLRMACLCMLQPYSKKTLTARDVMQFPWEENAKTSSRETVSDEELKRRYREAKRAAGLK